MKRLFALLMTAVLVLSLFSACGGGKGALGKKDDVQEIVQPDGTVIKGNFEVPAEGYDGSEVTIKFGHTMGAKLQEVLNYHIGEFNKLYPNIHIEHSTYGGWTDIADLVNTELMGDKQPNVAYCYPDHVATYNNAKAVIVLDTLIGSQIEITRADGSKEILGLTEEQKNDFIPGFYEEGKVYGDGLMYTLPMSKSTEVLYYNKTYFEANGLKVPTTWDEMEALCRQLKQLDPKCIPLGYDSEANMFITMAEQYGYAFTSASGDEHFLFNNAENKAMVKKLRGWFQEGLMTTEQLYGAYTSGLFTETDTTKSHSYMCIGSSGGASYQIPANKAFEVGVAPIPQANENNKKVISQGPSLCILSGGNTTDQQVVASWLFVKYLTTNMAFQTEFSSTSGYMPVIKSAQDNETYAAWLNRADGYSFLTALVVKVGLQESDSYFTSPAFNGSSTARAEVEGMVAKCLSKAESDVDKLINEAFQDAYDECVYMAG